MVDVANMTLLFDAQIGHLTPLANHIENGGNIDSEMRKFLSAYLRGEVKWKRGTKRTVAQRNREAKCQMLVNGIRKMESIYLERTVSEYEAMKKYIEWYEPQMDPETLKTYMKKGWKKPKNR